MNANGQALQLNRYALIHTADCKHCFTSLRVKEVYLCGIVRRVYYCSMLSILMIAFIFLLLFIRVSFKIVIKRFNYVAFWLFNPDTDTNLRFSCCLFNRKQYFSSFYENSNYKILKIIPHAQTKSRKIKIIFGYLLYNDCALHQTD